MSSNGADRVILALTLNEELTAEEILRLAEVDPILVMHLIKSGVIESRPRAGTVRWALRRRR